MSPVSCEEMLDAIQMPDIIRQQILYMFDTFKLTKGQRELATRILAGENAKEIMLYQGISKKYFYYETEEILKKVGRKGEGRVGLVCALVGIENTQGGPHVQ
jgi:DNA-binding CsgD family transcriptional regulator